MIVKGVISLSAAAIVSAVAAHRLPPSTLAYHNGGTDLQAPADETFPLLAKGDRPALPAALASLTIERRIGNATSVLIRIPAPDLASR